MGEETCCPACGYGVDYEPFIAAGPSETEIRVVPESAVAEAVAAERERIIQLAAQEAARLTRAAQEAEDGPLTSLGSQALTRFINRLRDPT